MAKENSNFPNKNINNAWKHFLTITYHKMLVMKGCFRVGLYKQGILHDLSKYSREEFLTGVRYYQGTRSPNTAEREEKGYSSAWLHHKGRNKHHFEYWTDVSGPEDHWKIAGVKMPVNYFVEMVMDRIAASKVYQGKNYTDASPYLYFLRNKAYLTMHPETKDLLDRVLRMLMEEGERKTFAYLRYLLKKGTVQETPERFHKRVSAHGSGSYVNRVSGHGSGSHVNRTSAHRGKNFTDIEA